MRDSPHDRRRTILRALSPTTVHSVQALSRLTGVSLITIRRDLAELAHDGLLALGMVVLGIVIYLAFRFEWKFAVAAVIANLHDIIIILVLLEKVLLLPGDRVQVGETVAVYEPPTQAAMAETEPLDASHIPIAEVLPHVGPEAALFSAGVALLGAMYGATTGDSGALLRAYTLDKALYEVVYESRNRPGWVPVPMGAVERILAAG